MLNQCNVIGRLGRDPESRFTASGKQVVNVSIACSEKRNGQESTEWINVIFWEKLAEIAANYLAKGSLVFISGRMQTRKWQDKEGGTRYTTEIIAREMQMLSPKGESRQEGTSREEWKEPPPMDDSIPF